MNQENRTSGFMVSFIETNEGIVVTRISVSAENPEIGEIAAKKAIESAGWELDIKSSINLSELDVDDKVGQNKNDKPSKRIRYSYLMIDENTGLYKIGKSYKPTYRERTLQSEKPTVSLVHKWPESIASESSLHSKYSDKRVRGEWFSLTQQDVKEILELVN